MRSLAVLLFAARAAASTPVLLARGDSLAGWTIQGPGALSLSTDVTPWSGKKYFNISYDFEAGGWQVAISPLEPTVALSVPGPLTLSFAVFTPVGSESIIVSVEDSGWTSRGSWPYLASAGWHNVSLVLAPNASDWLPRPAGDAMPLPLRSLSLGAGSGNAAHKVGFMGLADIVITSSAAPGAIPNAVTMTLLQPAGDAGDGTLISGGGGAPVALGVAVLNRLPQACTAAVTVEARNASGPMGDGAWAACDSVASLPPWGAAALTCGVDPRGAPPGYVVVRATFSASDCWTATDTQQVVEGALAIVGRQPPHTAVARNLRAGVFGGQMVGAASAAAAIGMTTVRAGPMWDWSQHSDCWNVSAGCLSWSLYDEGMLAIGAAGLELMIDARADVPPWAAFKNDSGPTWASFPGPEHYADYQRWLTIMLDRYAGMASAVEVSNEQDGLAYFMPSAVPLETAIDWTLASINITAAAMAASVNGSGLLLVGLSSSMFDVKQNGNGGSAYMQYEKTVLAAPGVMAALNATSPHPYNNDVWVPWVNPGWGNLSFSYFNESVSGLATNSSTAQILATAALMRAEAAAAGLGEDYAPALWPSEWGYNLIADVALSEGWTFIHAALVAQGLIHLRSAPLAAVVRKAFYFAADDSCCIESSGFFGLWRSAQRRTGANATQPAQKPQYLAPVVPLPSAAAFSAASLLVDVPSKRLAGVFVVDHSADGSVAVNGSLPPTCVAFAPDPAAPAPAALPLVALFITGHHFNDRTVATLTLATPPVRATSGLGAALPLATAGAGAALTLTLTLAPLPTYVELAAGTDAAAACATLAW